ncbi:MAG: hypothetical protein ABIF09_12705, partial [Gemmatimonadota bacterium]
AQRPTYALADSFLQFHYAVLDPHGPILRERNPEKSWKDRLSSTFDSLVRGPVFEEQARSWVRRHADSSTLGGEPDHVGPTTVAVDGSERQVDVVVATSDHPGALPSERRVLALGEAKSGETMGKGRLRTLEEARGALGIRASGARLLLFAPAFAHDLKAEASGRDDLHLIDLDRLYHGV